MRKKILAAIALLLCLSILLCGCSEGDNDTSSVPAYSYRIPSATPSEEQSELSEGDVSEMYDESSEVEVSAEPVIPDANAKLIWKDEYADAENNIAVADDIGLAQYYFNRELTNDYNVAPATGDAKYIFSGSVTSRVVNLSDGYMLSLPSKDIVTDFTLSGLRSKYSFNGSMLTVSKETKSPYGNTEHGWNIYLTEWLNLHIANRGFLNANILDRTRENSVSTDELDGYTILKYSITIKNPGDCKQPFYNVAIIRKTNVYNSFYLFVMKSEKLSNSAFDKIVKSFSETSPIGKSENDMTPYELVIPEYWDTETKDYFEYFCAKDTVDWGIFTSCLPDSTNDYDKTAKRLGDSMYFFEGSEGLDYEYKILPTYTHIGWGKTLHQFPLEGAQEFAGGNGFNNKPVLQFSYQFTTSNNTNLGGYTPMFDILRGDYDEHFTKLAKDIKTYGKPVLFRLNNEMNSDWVSYAGIVTLLDPDIFVECWRHLYDIFVEQGVDNCIWIFNPIAKSVPYGNWGDALNYMPGVEYMQLLGLTYYEMGNGTEVPSFKDMYTELYEINMPYFKNYSFIISEFACGAGGEKFMDYDTDKYIDTELGRNEDLQAQWITDMFKCFSASVLPSNEFCRKIKGAIWFSCNDKVDIGGSSFIINYLSLDKSLQKTLTAFREGLSNH